MHAEVNETDRLQCVQGLGLLDTEAESSFDLLCQRTARTFRAPFAAITLVDQDRLWMKSSVGMQRSELPRSDAFCSYAILRDEPFVIPDTHLDERFAHHPMVTGAEGLRFYAGAPLVLANQFRVGTLCIADHRPRSMESIDLILLRRLASQVVDTIQDHQSRLDQQPQAPVC